VAQDAEGERQVPGQVPSSWRGASEETFIAEDQRFAAWLRTHIQPCYDTSVLSLAEAARRPGEGATTRYRYPANIRRAATILTHLLVIQANGHTGSK